MVRTAATERKAKLTKQLADEDSDNDDPDYEQYGEGAESADANSDADEDEDPSPPRTPRTQRGRPGPQTSPPETRTTGRGREEAAAPPAKVPRTSSRCTPSKAAAAAPPAPAGKHKTSAVRVPGLNAAKGHVGLRCGIKAAEKDERPLGSVDFTAELEDTLRFGQAVLAEEGLRYKKTGRGALIVGSAITTERNLTRYAEQRRQQAVKDGLTPSEFKELEAVRNMDSAEALAFASKKKLLLVPSNGPCGYAGVSSPDGSNRQHRVFAQAAGAAVRGRGDNSNRRPKVLIGRAQSAEGGAVLFALYAMRNGITFKPTGRAVRGRKLGEKKWSIEQPTMTKAAAELGRIVGGAVTPCKSRIHKACNSGGSYSYRGYQFEYV